MTHAKLTQSQIKSLKSTVADLETTEVDQVIVQNILGCLDLTNLDDDASLDDIKGMCERAETAKGNVAAVCVYPRYVEYVFDLLRHNTVKVCTVVNYPNGNEEPDRITAATQDIINAGAQEIDIVIPYEKFIDGDALSTTKALKACQEAMTETAVMKVIIETGAFEDDQALYHAARVAIDNGADFLKTSTGKHALGASFHASSILMQAIKDAAEEDGETHTKVGIKISGGVSTAIEAVKYYKLTEKILGEDWLDASRFRIGASGLLKNLLDILVDEGENPIKENIDHAY